MNTQNPTHQDFPAAQARKLVSYDPMTGFIESRTREPLRTCMLNGYLMVTVHGRKIAVHRLAWLFQFGKMPPAMIDHINRDRTDNRIVNLREANASENQYNRPLQKNNRSGVKGVHWRAARNCWQVVITAGGKRRFYQSFKTLGEAESAARLARARLHGEFAMN